MGDHLEEAMKVLEGLKGQWCGWGDPDPFLSQYCQEVDRTIAVLFRELGLDLEEGSMALVAVGGYGRCELSPWSDVDLMFLCRDTASRQVLEAIYRVLHALWDLHFEVGHSVRTIQDCVDVAFRDIRTWTAMLDARLLCGDEELYNGFSEAVKKELLSSHRECFIRELIGSTRERHKSYSRSPYLIEPHVKNGPGGLRDLQSGFWLFKAAFHTRDLDDMVSHSLLSAEEAHELVECRKFIWKIRLHMHKAKRRKEDHLTFELQEALAEAFPASWDAGTSPEALMREYYRNTTRIRYFVDEAIQRVTDPSLGAGPGGPTYYPKELGPGFQVVRGRLTVVDDEVFLVDPSRMMEAICYAHCKGLTLDLLTKDEIKRSVSLVDDAFRRSRKVRDAFLRLLDSRDCGFGALEFMHRVGLLQAYMPEFQSICFKVQYDAYHAFTVDVHSLETVRELGSLRAQLEKGEGPIPQRTGYSIRSWSGLALAGLLHDIGKGEGPGHAEKGAKIAEGILERMWMPEEERERVIFLVKEHITMMDTALGRDLADEKVIVDLCRVVGSVERLDELYLLTLADLRATAPDVLTDWKDQLLRELYIKARRILETGELVSPETTFRVRMAREKIRAALRGKVNDEELEGLMEALPSRYLLSTPEEDLPLQVLTGLQMIRDGSVVKMVHRMKEDHQEILLCTRDVSGLFSRICGVMVAHGLNILEARIHTWSNGIAMDTFTVEPLGGGPRSAIEPEKVQEMEKDLGDILQGKMSLKDLLARRARPQAAAHTRYPRISPKVRIDNKSSDFYTVIEVRATDRFGLLFAVTKTIAELGLGISVAIIDTRKGRVMDVFYVQDSSGQKVWEETKLSAIERALYQALERLETTPVEEMA